MRPVRCRLAIDENKKGVPRHIKMDLRKIEMRPCGQGWLSHVSHPMGDFITGQLPLDQGGNIEVG